MAKHSQKSKTNPERDRIQAAVYLEKETIEEIDRLGRESRRSRSQMIAAFIDEGIASRREAVAIGK